jgi:hypothetical protein
MFRSARLFAVVMIILVTCVAISAQTMDKAKPTAPTAAVGYFDKTQVAKALSSGTAIYDGKTFRVQMGKRTEAGQVEFHAKDTDVFYIVEGSATFVTGGTKWEENPRASVRSAEPQSRAARPVRSPLAMSL